MKASLLAVFAFFATFSFTPEQLEGRWEHIYHDGTNAVYAKTTTMSKGPWIEFTEDGGLTVRQNAGWCGTPPISYRTYTGGSFDLSKSGQLTLKHEFWGGIDTTHYQIASVTPDTLRMRFLSRGMDE